MIGHDTYGSGPISTIVLNDWLCDTSTWDGARAYLDGARFTYAFADLRGYGRSIEQRGSFTVPEAAGDVMALADAIGWTRFAIVGHSMSTLVALHLAQQQPDRVDRAVVICPVPPTGMGAGEAMVDRLRAMARADDGARLTALQASGAGRLTDAWLRFKVSRWRASADPEAVAGYAAMFARDGLPDPAARIAVPVLAITGEQDAEVMRRDAVTALLSPLCDRLAVTPLAECGHYPMQEAPPLLVSTVERFLG